MLFLATLPIVLRVLLLPRYPSPQPIFVVLFPVAAFCASCYWMLRGWIAPPWALFGGLLCVFKFGPLSAWMNSNPDAAIPATAMCLIVGALPRLRKIQAKNFEKLGRFSFAARILLSLSVAQFLFWYGLHLWAPDAVVAAMGQYEKWP
jgi:hypothetical protein